MSKSSITIVIGPTGAGKTRYALKLAEETGAEIISADAFQVYRGLDIGTDKVSQEIRQQIPHHLIDILAPTAGYSVAQFMDQTDAIINSRTCPLIICGGTAFYTYSFLYGYQYNDPQRNDDVVQSLNAELERHGGQYLWDRLNTLDPETASTIHPNNSRRVIRALEIVLVTGKPREASRHPTPRADCKIVGIQRERDALYHAINQRVENMISSGFVQEVHQLLKSGVPQDCPAFSAIGYPQVIDYLNGRISYPKMIELVQQYSRNYAKRQLTWYRRFENVHWISLPSE